MTEKRARLYLILSIACGGAAHYFFEILTGEPAEDAAISTVIFMAIFSLMFLFLWRRRRRTLRRIAGRGEVECYIRRPEAAAGDRYRRWNVGLVRPAPGVLTFQPVLGRTSISRGHPFDIRIEASSGSRYPATKWDKFTRLEPNAVVLPLQTDEGPVEVAGQSATLDSIEEALARKEPRAAREHAEKGITTDELEG